ncbi:MAG: phage capsid protein, partial [Methylomonas sp.]
MADSVSPLVIEPHLSAVAINFKQEGMIADMVLPRTPVDSQEFISTKDRLQDWITPPDTFVGRTGQVNELSSSLQDAVYLATRDQGLDERVPNRDNRQRPSNRALMRAVMRVMSLVEMRRELRAAALASNPASYASSVALSGSAQWNDQTSDPLDVLLSQLDRPFMRPN